MSKARSSKAIGLIWRKERKKEIKFSFIGEIKSGGRPRDETALKHKETQTRSSSATNLSHLMYQIGVTFLPFKWV